MTPLEFHAAFLAYLAWSRGSQTSGWRSPERNTHVGGHPNSYHMVGLPLRQIDMESSVFDSGPKKLLKALGRLVGADQPPDAATLAEMSGAFGMIPMGGRLANRSLQQLRFNAPGELLERITDMLKGGRIQGFHGTRLDPNLAQGALVPKRRDLHIGTIDAALGAGLQARSLHWHSVSK
jgi:hypothetical protein